MPELTRDELNLLHLALNDREGVLAGDYERARRAESWALIDTLRGQLTEVRALADKVAAALR